MFQIENILDRIRLLFSKEKESYFALYRILGFFPHHIEFYREALLHKSSTVRNVKGRPLNNERLEFLGDAILDAVVADIVYNRYPGKREGFLTNTRSKIVQRETLNRLAREIGLDKHIKYSMRTSNHNSYMCGNAFEALVGAVYLDRGYAYCHRFMEKRILQSLIDIDKVAYKEVNFKSKLIEWCQKNKVEMEFRVVEESQDLSSPFFRSEVTLESLVAGHGEGYSKKESQQTAAKEALARLKKDALFLDSVYAAKQERNDVAEVFDESRTSCAVACAAVAGDTEDTVGGGIFMTGAMYVAGGSVPAADDMHATDVHAVDGNAHVAKDEQVVAVVAVEADGGDFTGVRTAVIPTDQVVTSEFSDKRAAGKASATKASGKTLVGRAAKSETFDGSYYADEELLDEEPVEIYTDDVAPSYTGLASVERRFVSEADEEADDETASDSVERIIAAAEAIAFGEVPDSSEALLAPPNEISVVADVLLASPNEVSVVPETLLAPPNEQTVRAEDLSEPTDNAVSGASAGASETSALKTPSSGANPVFVGQKPESTHL